MLDQYKKARVNHWLKFSLLILLMFVLWQHNIQPISAATWTVCQTGGCHFSSIQAAIDSLDVNDGDALEFPVNKETYREIITIEKSLTFVGRTTSIDAEEGGTAVTISGNPTVVMQNMIIQNGSIADHGAGIRLNSGNLTLTNVTLHDNNATGTGLGGALYIANVNSMVQLSDVTMHTNMATLGGAIYNHGTLQADDLILIDNTAEKGGGLYNNGPATLDTQSTVQRNIATESGGGIYNKSGINLTVHNSDLSNNEASEGAGIFNEGILDVQNTNLGSSNKATQAGAGLYNSGEATLLNSAVVQNQSNTGAGIYNAGTLTITNSTLSRNAGPENAPATTGAGLYNASGSATLNSVTIHLTIGASIWVNGGSVVVSNTIISSVSSELACEGTAVSYGYNLASDESCTFLTAPGDVQGVNPELNGITSISDGAAYHVPKLISPVVDAGSPAKIGSGNMACLATDQRGLARPQANHCDIGAVEIVAYRIFIPVVINDEAD